MNAKMIDQIDDIENRHSSDQGCILLTWINLNLRMDK